MFFSGVFLGDVLNQSILQLLELEVHLPNSVVKSYQVSKNGKLEDTLKFICDKEHLKANDHYFHHLHLTDDSLDMNLRVRDMRTHVIRVLSKRGMYHLIVNVIFLKLCITPHFQICLKVFLFLARIREPSEPL